MCKLLFVCRLALTVLITRLVQCSVLPFTESAVSVNLKSAQISLPSAHLYTHIYFFTFALVPNDCFIFFFRFFFLSLSTDFSGREFVAEKTFPKRLSYFCGFFLCCIHSISHVMIHSASVENSRCRDYYIATSLKQHFPEMPSCQTCCCCCCKVLKFTKKERQMKQNRCVKCALTWRNRNRISFMLFNGIMWMFTDISWPCSPFLVIMLSSRTNFKYSDSNEAFSTQTTQFFNQNSELSLLRRQRPMFHSTTKSPMLI